MSTTRNLGLIYTAAPSGVPVPGKDLTVQDRPVDLNAAIPDGTLLVKNHYISFDPYQRGRMRDPAQKSYNVPFQFGEAITNSAISTVLKSANPNFKEGDQVEVYMTCPTEEYSVLPKALVDTAVRVLDNPHGLDPVHFTHALGMPGLTAYSSLYEIGGPLKAGQTIFISSAAGAVGQVVGQIAKRNGLKVIGSVGDQAKLDFILQKCNYDAGFNYKEEKAALALPRLAPEGIDIYYENVGGEQLEAAISNMKPFGKIIACGMVSQYNVKPEEAYGVKTLMNMVRFRIKMQGFVVSDPGFRDKYEKEHREVVSKWIAEGSFVPQLSVTNGIANSAEGFVGMLQGKNFGKAVLKV